jgi:hypothetical protein
MAELAKWREAGGGNTPAWDVTGRDAIKTVCDAAMYTDTTGE